MKHKTSELSGALLDAAVAKASGMEYEIQPQKVWGDGGGITIFSAQSVCLSGAKYFEPSTDWRTGGPIIERERIVTSWAGIDIWFAGMSSTKGIDFGGDVSLKSKWWSGTTPLIAAMRAYAASKFGEEVEL